MSNKWIAIVDLGSPHTQFIARQTRHQQVYSEVVSSATSIAVLRARVPAGIVLSGVAEADLTTAALPELNGLLALGIPVMAVIYGKPVTARMLTGPAANATAQEYSDALLHEFVFTTCGCQSDWHLTAWVDHCVARLKKQIGDEEVVLGLSGGVDSSVVAVLLHKAIGKRLHCIFVDTGLLRHNEEHQVEEMFRAKLGMDLHVINARERFYTALKGVTDPEEKRKIIGHAFIDVFAEEARKFRNCKFLGQGTIYPDVIESISPLKQGQKPVKSHHNVGGLPLDLKFELVEPVRELFKDEVRAVGRVLNMDAALLERQPFPGPGLGVRILGEITAERVALLQQADLRVQEEMSKLPNYKEIWQSFAILLPVNSVGVKEHQRTYESVCVLRVVESVDAMTATWSRVPYDTLDTISHRIISEVPGINRVVYDISSKPPATIEWE